MNQQKMMAAVAICMISGLFWSCDDNASKKGSVNPPEQDCELPKVLCNDSCIDPMTDNAYCGADAACQNYTACFDGQECVGGSCSAKPVDGKCLEGQVKCGEACIDPLINQTYCGADANCQNYTACVDGQMCQGGVCTARPDECIDSGSDINCQTDDSNAVARCEGNSCIVECKDGFSKVDGFCKPIDTPKTCDPGRVLCGDNCVDPQINMEFCGANENCEGYISCGDGQICQEGACMDRPDECIDSGSDINCQTDDPNAVARCEGNSCIVECKDGFSKVDGFCKANPTPQDPLCMPNKRTCTITPEGKVISELCSSNGMEILPEAAIECPNDDPNAMPGCDENGECITTCKESYVKVDGTCKLIHCTLGETRCDGNRVMICNESMTGFDEQEVCTTTEANKVATCSGGQCITSCDDYSVEVDGACLPKICEPYIGTQCDGNNNVDHCNGTGTAYDQKEYCTASGEHATAACSAGKCIVLCIDGYLLDDGECKPVSCTPGELTCNTGIDGDSVVVCNASGTGYTVKESCKTDDPNRWANCHDNECVTECKTGTIEVDGVCTMVICEANSIDCKGDKVVKCNSTGTAYETQEICTTSDEHAAPICKNGACTKVCNDTYIDVGGVCTQVACTANQIQCDGDRIVECNSVGTAFTVKTDCSNIDPNAVGTCALVPGGGAKCDKTCKDGYAINNMDGGKCKKIVCEPDTQSCAASSIITCNSSGTGYDPHSEVKCETTAPNAIAVCDSAKLTCVTICKDGYVEVDGVCTEIICTSGKKQCVDSNLEVCDSTGTAWAAELCTTTDPHATAFCNEVNLSCDTSCNDGYVEVGGVCTEIICAPGNYRCSSDNKKQDVCNSTGTAWNIAETCTTTDPHATAICDDENARCSIKCADDYVEVDGVCELKQICTPNEATCADDHTMATCSEDGMSYESLLSCQTGQKCEDGVCKCQTAGLVNCGDCIDPNTSDNYCGADNTCSSYSVCLEHSSCQSGSCQCDTGYIQCGSECIDPKTSNAYCGADNACGNYTTCNPDQTCVNGQCKCDSNLVACGSECIDPKTNNTYCGADNTCGSYTTCRTDQTCQNGACKCQTGMVMCDGVCIDPKTSNSYCGAEGTYSDGTCYGYKVCDENKECTNGRCECVDGLEGCYQGSYEGAPVVCTDTNSDPKNCGGCKTNCFNKISDPQIYYQCRLDPDNCPYEASCNNGVCSLREGCITFTDSVFKTYALTHWDTNHDSCLSVTEARAVTEIPDNAFANSNIQTLADLKYFMNLTKIGNKAFEGCTKLKTVDLNQVTTIGYYAFSGCTSLDSIASHNVTTVGDHAFYNSGVKSIELGSVKTIPASMCERCGSLETLKFTSATSIGDSAFQRCIRISNIHFPYVKSIGEYAFSESVYPGAAMEFPSVTQIKNHAFENSHLKTIELRAEDDIDIGEDAFVKADILTTVKAKNAYRIGSYAFAELSKLTTVYIDNVVRIEESAFYECRNLTTVSSTNALPRLDKMIYRALYGTAIKSLSLPNVTFIGTESFNNTTMDYLYINGNYKASWYSFENATISHLKANVGTITTAGCGNSEIGYYEHTGGTIDDDALKGCDIYKFESYAISLGKRAFKDSKIEIVDLYNIKEIPEEAFMGTKLHDIELPKAVAIGERAFKDNTKLEFAILPNVIMIGNQAFYNTPELGILYMPRIMILGSDVFTGSYIQPLDSLDCLAVQQETCSSGHYDYCVNPTFFGTGYKIRWVCPEGTTCSKSAYGAKICE